MPRTYDYVSLPVKGDSADVIKDLHDGRWSPGGPSVIITVLKRGRRENQSQRLDAAVLLTLKAEKGAQGCRWPLESGKGSGTILNSPLCFQKEYGSADTSVLSCETRLGL